MTPVVAVVSAQAGVTNSLIERAKAIHKNPSDRELDVLMTCGEQETIALCAWPWIHWGFLRFHAPVGKRELLRKDCMRNQEFVRFQVGISESN